MTKKMTAVEWLAKEICYINDDGKYIVDDAEDVTHIVQKAKEIEKEQIEEAFNLGYDQWTVKTSEQYYKETYEQE